MTNFKAISNRDAWSVFRGYGYQINITILRWINLKDNDLLELERGEDIDIVQRDICRQTISRELEQIKFHDSNISLNRTEIIEILFNFFTHLQNNHDQNLLFRYVTNSTYTFERPAIFPQGMTGIEVWQELYTTSKVTPDDTRIATIGQHLSKRISEKIKELTTKAADVQVINKWKSFDDHVRDNKLLLAFIKKFEWSFSNDDDSNLNDAICQEIVKVGITVNTAEASEVYSRLFLFIFKFLSSKGIKSLSKKDLKTQTQTSVTSHEDLALLESLKLTFNNFESRLTMLEEDRESKAKAFDELFSEMAELTTLTTEFNYKLKTLATSPPTKIKQGIFRREKVAVIESLVNTYNWISLTGLNGSGKSQLASDACSLFSTSYWLDLRSYREDSEKVSILIETFLTQISLVQITANRLVWINRVMQSFQDATLIVFNDLPPIDEGSTLYNLLLLLGDTVGPKSKLITTSNHPVPVPLVQSLGSQNIVEYDEITFTNNEIVEYFQNYGYNVEDGHCINLIVATTQRNPRLISSVIYRIQKEAIANDVSSICTFLLTNDLSYDVLKNSQTSIQNNIRDISTRNLLYRLSLIKWGFTNKELLAVCNVNESIKHPLEKFNDLLNIWIQDNHPEYQVSPLIYDIGKSNLQGREIKDVHVALAESILETKSLNMVTASRCISEYINGSEFSKAAGVYLNILRLTASKAQAKTMDNWGFSYYWVDKDLNKSVNVVLRALIRREQLRIFSLLNKDASVFRTWLTKYSAKTENTISENFVIHYIILSEMPRTIPLDEYYTHVLFLLDNLSEAEIHLTEIFESEIFSGFLWLVIQDIRTYDEIIEFLAVSERVEKRFNINFWSNDIAVPAATILAGTLLDSLEDAPVETSENQIRNLSSYFRNKSEEIIATIFIKKLFNIQFRVDPSRVLQMAEDEIKNISSDLSKYLIHDTVGRIFYNTDKHISKDHLQRATSLNCESYFYFYETLIFLAALIRDEDRERTLEICLRAKQIVLNNKVLTELDYIRVLGELAIAYYRVGNLEECFLIYEDIFNRLIATKGGENQLWLDTLVTTGHSLGYITQLANTGSPPYKTGRGEEYLEPYVGIYIVNNANLSDYYIEDNEPILMAQLALFSEGLGNLQKAYVWSKKAFDEARRRGNRKIIYQACSVYFRYSVGTFHVKEAFEAGEYYLGIMYHAVGATIPERFEGTAEVNFEEIKLKKPSEQWKIAEDYLISRCILPMYFSVLLKKLTQDPKAHDDFVELMISYNLYEKSASNGVLWVLIDELLKYSFEHDSFEVDQEEVPDLPSVDPNIGILLQLIKTINVINDKPLAELSVLISLIKAKIGDSLFQKHIIYPVLKSTCILLIKKYFVGSKQEMSDSEISIDELPFSNENSFDALIHLMNQLDLSF
jgi:hypothetical protein